MSRYDEVRLRSTEGMWLGKVADAKLTILGGCILKDRVNQIINATKSTIV